ncbi:hypothetical protein BD769DRAFT_1682312 [Suillus cothurnatus]|nr:hypothetical protein BD769DRAFT_1682312 [Suillus cothurnatus]
MAPNTSVKLYLAWQSTPPLEVDGCFHGHVHRRGHCQATILGGFGRPFPSEMVILSYVWTADLVLVPCALSASIVDFHSELLSVGGQDGLSVYTLILENDLLTWSKEWEVGVATTSLAKFAATLAYIATTSHFG